MTIVIEDGTGKIDSESYISIADSLVYHSARGNATWATITTAQAEEALRRATEYMIQIYRMRWKGVRMLSTQALDWPRTGVNLESAPVASDSVPIPVRRACAELALKAAAGALLADVTQQKESLTVGPISTTYDKFSPQAKRYLAIDAMLAPYMAMASGTLKAIRA